MSAIVILVALRRRGVRGYVVEDLRATSSTMQTREIAGSRLVQRGQCQRELAMGCEVGGMLT